MAKLYGHTHLSVCVRACVYVTGNVIINHD